MDFAPGAERVYDGRRDGRVEKATEGDLINYQFSIFNSHPIGWEFRIDH